MEKFVVTDEQLQQAKTEEAEEDSDLNLDAPTEAFH